MMIQFSNYYVEHCGEKQVSYLSCQIFDKTVFETKILIFIVQKDACVNYDNKNITICMHTLCVHNYNVYVYDFLGDRDVACY